MNTNMIGTIAKPEMTTMRPDKSLEVYSPFIAVSHVVLTKKITKIKQKSLVSYPSCPAS